MVKICKFRVWELQAGVASVKIKFVIFRDFSIFLLLKQVTVAI